MIHVAFAGTFAASLEPRVRAHLDVPCDVVLADETDIVTKLPDVDVLVTMAFTGEMGAAASRLKLAEARSAASGKWKLDPATIRSWVSRCRVSVTGW